MGAAAGRQRRRTDQDQLRERQESVLGKRKAQSWERDLPRGRRGSGFAGALEKGGPGD